MICFKVIKCYCFILLDREQTKQEDNANLKNSNKEIVSFNNKPFGIKTTICDDSHNIYSF